MESIAGKLDLFVMEKRVQYLKKLRLYKYDEKKEEKYDCEVKNL
jgi:hypothetical protein